MILAGISDDLSWLSTNAPAYIADFREIVQKGGAYLPKIKTMVNKVGKNLPQAIDIINSSIQFLPTIKLIVEDPALPALVDRIKTLRDLEVIDVGDRTGVVPSSTAPIGIGLHRFIKPIDAYIWTRRHPNQTKAILVGGMLVLVGSLFMLGRLSKG